MGNLPEDWDSYWDVCPEHGVKHHMSEGCPICELSEEEEKAWIEKGDEYTKTVGTFDGYFVSNSWHTECHENHVQYIEDQRRKEG